MSENETAAPITDPKRECDTAKKRIILNRRVLNNQSGTRVQTTITNRTSTPKLGRTIMEMNFAHHFGDGKKLDIITALDQDSGYISSYHHESNSEYSVENDINSIKMMHNRPMFISEDALLEKPEISPKKSGLIQNDNEKSCFNTPLSDSGNKKIECSSTGSSSTSVVSQSLVYEGLETSLDTSTNMSIEIPVIDPIIIETNALSTRMDISTTEPLNNSISTGMVGLSLTTDFSCFIRQNPTSVMSEASSTTSATSISNNNREKTRLNLIISKANKENVYQVRRKYTTPVKSVSATKPLDPNVSPDLFDDDVVYRPPPKVEAVATVDVLTTEIAPEKYIDKRDELLLKRLQSSLGGVLPPPSVTTLNLSAEYILSKIEANKEYFWSNNDTKGEANTSNETCDSYKSVLSNIDSYSGLASDNKDFPEVLKIRWHGVNYNSSKISEQIDEMYEKFAKRFIGAETQSSLTVFDTNLGSPSKRRIQKQKFGTKSPGRRLSHLARRRITFSSASLQVGGSSLAGSRARQILVDARKIGTMRKKSPRKTPSKSPRVKSRTPTSSAKKKLAMRFKKITGELQNSSMSADNRAKKALFTSPDSKMLQGSARKSLFKSPEFENKHNMMSTSLFLPSTSASQSLKTNPRRALFVSPIKSLSPSKRLKSPFKRALGLSGLDTKKRKRTDSEDAQQCFDKSKIARIDNRPTSSENNDRILLNRMRNDGAAVLNRSTSQTELSDLHKKKLQWAVYEALKQQNIKPTHAEFKNFASTLARVTRRFLTNLGGSMRPEDGSGTSQRMLRIARQHVYSVVVKGKSVDEIMNDYVQQRSKILKPQGYIPIGNSNNAGTGRSGFKENVLQDRVNTMESWEKRKLEQLGKPKSESKIDRIRKVINFGDDHR